MPSYEAAPVEAVNLVNELAREVGRNLSRVRIAVMFARCELGGQVPPIEARPTSPLHRAGGCSDLLIIINAAEWSRKSTLGRAALVDHALASIRTVEAGGRLALDTFGRPRLRRVPKDCAVGYVGPWNRWKEASVEAQALEALKRAAPRDPAAKPRSKPTADGPRPDSAQPGGM